MRFNILILITFAGFPAEISAQADSLILTKNYRFNDGIYMSFEAFQSNTPDYQWSDLKANLVTNPQTFITQVQYIFIKNEAESIPLDLGKVWGISLAGIPYLRLDKNGSENNTTSFAGLQLRGKICYFSFDDLRRVKIPIHAYNPYNGRPFRSAVIEREKQIRIEKILNFETGEIADFNVKNLKNWIQDDKRLFETINSLNAEEAEEKLFKCLLIYVDRNVVRIKKF